MIVICGDVESNREPTQGSHRATRQNTLTYSPRTQEQQYLPINTRTPPPSQLNRSKGRNKPKPSTVSDAGRVMTFLRIMTSELREDLHSIHSKNDNINRSIDELKTENENYIKK